MGLAGGSGVAHVQSALRFGVDVIITGLLLNVTFTNATGVLLYAGVVEGYENGQEFDPLVEGSGILLHTQNSSGNVTKTLAVAFDPPFMPILPSNNPVAGYIFNQLGVGDNIAGHFIIYYTHLVV